MRACIFEKFLESSNLLNHRFSWKCLQPKELRIDKAEDQRCLISPPSGSQMYYRLTFFSLGSEDSNKSRVSGGKSAPIPRTTVHRKTPSSIFTAACVSVERHRYKSCIMLHNDVIEIKKKKEFCYGLLTTYNIAPVDNIVHPGIESCWTNTRLGKQNSKLFRPRNQLALELLDSFGIQKSESIQFGVMARK